MADLVLVIGNKNYSSWSLRPWLAMKVAGIPFAERLIPFSEKEEAPDIEASFKEAVAAFSPSLKVPVLIDGSLRVWESLAILETLAERFPEAGLWPAEAAARAEARSVCAEMASGFAALRRHMPMNVRASQPGRGQGPGVDADMARVAAIWRGCRQRFGAAGPFLFGGFSGADAMYAPVVSRLATYCVDLDGPCAAYRDAVLALPAMAEWSAAARAEPWTIAADEAE